MKTFKDLKVGDPIYYFDIYDFNSFRKLIISGIINKEFFTTFNTETNSGGFNEVWLPASSRNSRSDREYQLYVDPKAILEDIKKFTSDNVSIFDDSLIFNSPI